MKRKFFELLKGFLKLTRIEHSLMLVFAVLIGELLAFSSIKNFNLDTLAFISSLIVPSLLSMSAFAINDYLDYESDLINKRFDRPIVAKIIKRDEALVISIFLFILSLLLSFFLNEIAFAIAFIFGIFSFIYSLKLKDIALVGNLYVALCMAIPIIFGGIVAGSLNQKHIFIFSIILFAGIAREIAQSIRDYKGDVIARGSKNIVHLIGKRKSALISSVLYILAIFLSFVLFFFFEPYKLNIIYAILVGACDILLFYVATFSLFNYNNIEFMRKTRNITLIAMFLALLGFFFPLVF
jgi:geranylgeranylglycerol-phosphate geranylgeranyltransferase